MERMGRAATVAFVVAATMTGACSLFTALDGFDTETGAGADAATAETGIDSAADAGDDGSRADAEAERFCSTVDATFCEDFDGLGVSNRLAPLSIGAGSQRADDLRFTSSPRSFFYETPALGSGDPFAQQYCITHFPPAMAPNMAPSGMPKA